MSSVLDSTPTRKDWTDVNNGFLEARLSSVVHSIEHYAGGTAGHRSTAVDFLVHRSNDADGSNPIETLYTTFELSSFELDLLLLCAVAELDADFAALCANANGDANRAYATFGLAMAALPEATLSAIAPEGSLRFWRLIELGKGYSLMDTPLRIDERVLHFLAGVQHLDERLIGLIQPQNVRGELTESQFRIAERIARVWALVDGSALPAIQLCGSDVDSKYSVASTACAILGLNLHRLMAHAVPSSPAEREALIRLWTRESVFSNSALLLDCDDLDESIASQKGILTQLIEGIGGPLITSRDTRRSARHRSLLVFDVDRPTVEEQRTIWRESFGSDADHMENSIESVVSQFNLNASEIRAIREAVTSEVAVEEIEPSDTAQTTDNAQTAERVSAALWERCRVQTRPNLGSLAHRIDSHVVWDDLILPAAHKRLLDEIAIHVRNRLKVYEEWGFAHKSARGLGMSALFSGQSGTGKTMAAEVLSNTLRLDLYRIDLSAVISKYIGETEKNLAQVFDAAEGSGAILLFDEADALFGKRSEVKDSHDRYANIEVSYLLQRMEAYRGLAILTTNLQDAVDSAFLRRIRFVIRFPFPEMEQRKLMWERVFPEGAETDGLDEDKLARLNVTGGHIRNIAMSAAFLAADEGEPIQMEHLLRAARHEYAKLEKSLSGAETRGWI